MAYIDVEKWEPIGKMTLEESALKSIKNEGNLLVVAGPGAGKTELLAQKACYLLQTSQCPEPKKILAISFKKDAAENLGERVKKRCGEEFSYRFMSKTYDSFAKGIIDNFQNALPDEYKPDRSYEIANQSSITRAFNVAGAKRPTGLTNKQYTEMLNEALTSLKLPMELNTKKDVGLKRVWEILLKGDGELRPSLSFPMISMLAEYLIRENPSIKFALRQTYSHVFLDEFQDTTTLQYELIKTCFHESSSIITAVGDNKQRIMRWAGAKDDIFEVFQSDFNAIEKSLIMNHRSAPRLIEIQKVLYNYLQEDSQHITANEKWGNQDGIAEMWTFPNSKKEAETIASKINEIVQVEKISLNDICILVKQTPDVYGKEIINALEVYGINARNEALYQDLLKEEIVRLILDVIVSAFDKTNVDAWINILDVKKRLCGLGDTDQFRKVNSLIEELKKYLKEVKLQFNKISSIEELSAYIWDIVNYFDIESLKGLYPQYKQGHYINKLIEDLIQLLYQDYLMGNGWIDAVEKIKGEESISIMTIHKSKGLEYDTVFFVGLEDNAFWSYLTQSEEDTCAFFVALSRAKRRLVFTFSHKRLRREYLENQTRNNVEPFYEMLKESQMVEEKIIY